MAIGEVDLDADHPKERYLVAVWCGCAEQVKRFAVRKPPAC